jgi:hypothetical protein
MYVVQKEPRMVYINLSFHFRKFLAIQLRATSHRLEQVGLNPNKSHASMADTPPDEDMNTTPEPSKVPGGSQDLKDHEDESSEREEGEAVTLDLQPEGTEVFECPGDCKEYKPCGSEDCNALGELHSEDKKEVVENSSWGKDGEKIVHTRSPIIPTPEAEFVAWNSRIERLRKQAIKLHVSNLIFYRRCKNCNCIETLRRFTTQLITERNAKL